MRCEWWKIWCTHRVWKLLAAAEALLMTPEICSKIRSFGSFATGYQNFSWRRVGKPTCNLRRNRVSGAELLAPCLSSPRNKGFKNMSLGDLAKIYGYYFQTSSLGDSNYIKILEKRSEVGASLCWKTTKQRSRVWITLLDAITIHDP